MTKLLPFVPLILLACNEAPLPSETISQMEQALCENGDGVPSALAALAVATASELGRWQPTEDFRISRGQLALTAGGKRRCDAGYCWNIEAILDLQEAPSGQVVLGGMSFDAKRFRHSLLKNFEEQQRCEATHGRRDCPAERHVLSLDSVSPGACDTLYTFRATAIDGSPLKAPEQLANRLIYAGYPENEYLSFSSTETSVSIDPTYWLNPVDDMSSGACSAACMQVSRNNLAGSCCSCNGVNGTFERSSWSASTFVCR